MVNISLLLPTRGRSSLVYQLFDSILKTTSDPLTVEVVLYIDEDDIGSHEINYSGLSIIKLIKPRVTLGKATNICFTASNGRYVMLVNDDVIFRTKGWDTSVSKAFSKFPDDIALVYGNDLYQREKMSTFPILSRTVCKLMDNICPSDYKGPYIDAHIFDIFKRLARQGFNRIVYLDNVIFEHMHQEVGKIIPNVIYTKRNHQAEEPLFLSFTEERRDIALKIVRYIKGDRHCPEKHAVDYPQIREPDRNKSEMKKHIELNKVNFQPVVSIIIHAHNNLPSIVQCLKTLIDVNKEQIPFEIIIIDNGSTDKRVFLYLQKFRKKIGIIWNEKKLNFAKACNQAANVSKGKYLVFLESHAYPVSGWLGTLVKAMENDEQISIVGCKIINSRNGRIEHAGISFFKIDKDIKITFIYKGMNLNASAVNRPRELQSVNRIGMFIKKDIFLNVGGFDEALDNREDVDLCFKIRAEGKKIVYIPEAIIYYDSPLILNKEDNLKDSPLLFKKWKEKIEFDLDKILHEDGFSLCRSKEVHYILPDEKTIDNLIAQNKLDELSELLEAGFQIMKDKNTPKHEDDKRYLLLLCQGFSKLKLMYSKNGLHKKANRYHRFITHNNSDFLLNNYESSKCNRKNI